MSGHRFFLASALPTGGAAPVTVPLSAGDLHHAVRVLRLRAGEEITAVDPGGDARAVRLTNVSTEAIQGEVLGSVTRVGRTPHVTLYQGVLKGSSMDEVVQHSVELGVERIVPVVTTRTVVRLDDAKAGARVARWQRIAEGAARQSQREAVPQVGPMITMPWLARGLSEFDAALVLWEESDAAGVVDIIRVRGLGSAASVALVVGPEGGLAAEEVAGLVDAGAVECTLGTAVLRAQTAALAAVTLASFALGGLGAGSDAGDDGALSGRQPHAMGGDARA